jgi:hypothetical protein
MEHHDRTSSSSPLTLGYEREMLQPILQGSACCGVAEHGGQCFGGFDSAESRSLPRGTQRIAVIPTSIGFRRLRVAEI